VFKGLIRSEEMYISHWWRIAEYIFRKVHITELN